MLPPSVTVVASYTDPTARLNEKNREWRKNSPITIAREKTLTRNTLSILSQTTLLMRNRNAFLSAHVWAQDSRNMYTTIFLLIVFKHRNHNTWERQTRPIQRMDKLGLGSSSRTVPNLGASGLKVTEV